MVMATFPLGCAFFVAPFFEIHTVLLAGMVGLGGTVISLVGGIALWWLAPSFVMRYRSKQLFVLFFLTSTALIVLAYFLSAPAPYDG